MPRMMPSTVRVILRSKLSGNVRRRTGRESAPQDEHRPGASGGYQAYRNVVPSGCGSSHERTILDTTDGAVRTHGVGSLPLTAGRPSRPLSVGPGRALHHDDR